MHILHIPIQDIDKLTPYEYLSLFNYSGLIVKGMFPPPQESKKKGKTHTNNFNPDGARKLAPILREAAKR